LAEGDHRYPVKPPVWYRRRWFSALVVIVFFVAVAVVVVAPVSATDTLSYCSSCKETQAAERTWEQSAHREVECTSCHVPPGFAAQASWRLEEAKNIWASYLGVDRSPDRGHLPGNANCLKCHRLESIPDESQGVRMSHELHVNLRNVNCADCHDYVSHRKPGQSARVTMQTCPMCHNEQGAPDRCDFCHSAPPADAHRPDYLQEHGEEARLNTDACLRCHHDKETFCDACHALPPENHYSGTWRYTHSADAEDDPANCEACHDEAYCAQCHTVTHPSDWETQHGPASAQAPEGCLVCHAQGMCDDCHGERGVTL
jgi:nitrate/TMAO reductase-like tetraheme cytochrome c subunit